MSVRVEWFAAGHSAVDVVHAGTPIGDDAVDEGNVAVTIAADSVAVLEGSPDRVRHLLENALATVNAYYPPPAASVGCTSERC